MVASGTPREIGGMKTHIVLPGECLATIAKLYGFRDWKLLYEAPENDALRQRRPNPNVLRAGDEVKIPEREAKQLARPPEQRHRFRACSARWILRLRLLDPAGKAITDTPYRLLLDVDPAERSGRTDGDGMVIESLPAEARSGLLRILGDDIELALGDLDPIERVTGVQQRLRNLGYDVGPPDGIVGKRTRAAVQQFQRTQGLEPSAQIDDATRRRLVEVHDGATTCLEAEESMAPQDPPAEDSSCADQPGPGGVRDVLLADEEELFCRTPASRLYFALYYYDTDKAFRRAAETWWAEVQARNDFDPDTSEVILQEVVTEAELKDSFLRLEYEAKKRQALYVEGRIFSHASVYVFGLSEWRDESKWGLEYKKFNDEDGTVTRREIESLPKLPWTPDGLLVLHGCNSGMAQTDGTTNADNFARGQGVRTQGQRGWALFSESPTTYRQINASSPRVYLLPFSKVGRNLLRKMDTSGDVIPPYDTGHPSPAPAHR
jgi:hypothetical protein